MQGMRTEQEGFDDVVEEIIANQRKHGEAAGITAADVALLQTSGEQIALIDKDARLSLGDRDQSGQGAPEERGGCGGRQ
jgi:hypothetical protein